MLYLIINDLLMIIKPGSPRSHLNDCQECSEGPRSPHNSNAKVGSSAFARSAALRSHMWRIRPTTGTSNSGGRRQHEKHVCKVADANFTQRKTTSSKGSVSDFVDLFGSGVQKQRKMASHARTAGSARLHRHSYLFVRNSGSAKASFIIQNR